MAEKIEQNEILKDWKITNELSDLFAFMLLDLTKELPTLNIDVDYFILSVFMDKKSDIYKRLSTCMISSTMDMFASTWYQTVSSKALSATKPNRIPVIDAKFAKILENAKTEAKELNAEKVSSEHVFLSILNYNEDTNKAKKAFGKAGVTYNILKSKMMSGNPTIQSDATPKKKIANAQIKVINFSNPEDANEFLDKALNGGLEGWHNGLDLGDAEGDNIGINGITRRVKGKAIMSYCTDVNDLAERGKIEPLVGRDREIGEIIRILGRKKKNNAILLGAEGVGKTAIAESLALKIINKEVPEFLFNKKVVSLDMTALMAGTTLRGMFEERVKAVLDEIKKDGNYILLMDNIGAMLADKGKNDYEISAMLSRSLESGEIQVIGTSDFASYRKTFDSDPSLARRFQKIVVEPSTISESIDILGKIRSSYEDFHKVVYSDEAIKACVVLADRYLPERNLPDSAIDLIDEIGAMKGLVKESDELLNLRGEIEKKEEEISEKKRKKRFNEADALSAELVELKKKYNEERKRINDERSENPPTITKGDILNIVSLKTGIPVSNLTSDDKEKLSKMNERIKADVIGQDDAIETICRALKRNRIGLHKNGCMYSMMAIGKSGVGKTLIAKKLAKELFGDERNLVRFDMSEYSDKVAVNKLIGSNPGYVGYEEGGQLTETIKNKKHCVLLLDEIEKADPEIYNIFLQVLDEGFLTDNSGMRVDFKNVIVIFTSNIGTKTAGEFGKGIGFSEDESENTKKILSKELKGKFPPEFLNRVDNIIYFNSLTDDNLKDIIKIEMRKFDERLSDIGYKSNYTNAVIEYIFNIVKEQKEFGARPILRAIQDNIEDKITDLLLEKDYKEKYKFKIDVKDNEIVVK